MAPVKHFRVINLHEGDRHTFRCGAKYVVQKVNGKLRLVEEVETENDNQQKRGKNDGTR